MGPRRRGQRRRAPCGPSRHTSATEGSHGGRGHGWPPTGTRAKGSCGLKSGVASSRPRALPRMTRPDSTPPSNAPRGISKFRPSVCSERPAAFIHARALGLAKLAKSRGRQSLNSRAGDPIAAECPADRGRRSAVRGGFQNLRAAVSRHVRDTDFLPESEPRDQSACITAYPGRDSNPQAPKGNGF